VKQQIKRLEEPSLKCCQLVYDELIKILGQILPKIVGNFPRLNSLFPRVAWCLMVPNHTVRFQAVSGAREALQFCDHQFPPPRNGPNDQTCLQPCRVRTCIHTIGDVLNPTDPLRRMQACYINTTHPDFINGHKVFCLHRCSHWTVAHVQPISLRLCLWCPTE
jgi:hypothetical protein